MADNKLITFVGTGGVGKTSLSLSVAIEAAKQGKKVAAITIDPSKRLSQVIGGKTLSSMLGDRLEVFSIDTEVVFQKFVSSHLSEAVYGRLSENQIYQQISKNLRETHNFAALYKMVEILDLEKYDLIVLDTPPCHQVIDFFESPWRLKNFFSPPEATSKKTGIKSWVADRGMQAAESIFGGIVGHEFVDEVKNFFQAVVELRESINRVSDRFVETLQSEESCLLLVFSSALDKVAEVRYLQREILKNKFLVNGFILNRGYFPQLSHLDSASLKNEQSQSESHWELLDYFLGQKQRSLNLLADLKNQDSDCDFVLLPEIQVQLEQEQDIIDFSTQLSDHWSAL